MPDDLENRDKEVHVQLFNDHIWQFSFSYIVYKKYILSFKLCYFNTKQFLFLKKSIFEWWSIQFKEYMYLYSFDSL